MSARAPTLEQLDARETYLRGELAALEYADDFTFQREQTCRIEAEFATIARWREILAEQITRGIYLPLTRGAA